MKPCKPIREHIDQNEFGDGRKITTSLLSRFCTNISGLWNKTEELEDNTDPELRKRFTPPIIHDLHSYGITLNHENRYVFDNNTETIFLDPIGLKTIEITDIKLEEETFENNKYSVYTFESIINIAKIALNTNENNYPLYPTLTELQNKDRGCMVDGQKLYFKTTEQVQTLYLTIHSIDPYIDHKNTTAHINLTKNQIHSPYSLEQFKEEVLDQNTAIQYTIGPNNEEITTIRGVEKYWNFGWRRFNHFWMYPLWLQDPFSENPNTPPIPTVARAFILTPRNTGLLTKIQLMFHVKNGAEDDVYCEIRETNKDGSPSNKILAREKTRIRGAAQAFLHTIEFSTSPLLTQGNKYAVVVRAGFTSSEKSYGLGGWSSWTYGAEFFGNILHKTAAKIEGKPNPKWERIHGFDEDILSTIYTSTDNGVSWTLSGNGPLDRMRPRAFSYQTFIKPIKNSETLETGTFVVYWKPIKTNPIQTVQLTPSTQNNGIKWEISVNMKDWHQIQTPNWNYNFNTDGAAHEKDQNILYIRAKLESKEGQQPIIEGLKAIIKTKPATTAYLKTLFYNPRLGNLLGASLWSRLGTQVELTPPLTDNVEVTVDVIRNMIMKDTIQCNGHNMTFTLSEKPSKPLINVTIHPHTPYIQIENPQTTTTPTTSTTTITTDTKKLEQLQKILTEIDGIYIQIKQSTETNHQNYMETLAHHFPNLTGIIQTLQCNNNVLTLLKESIKPLKTLDGCNKSECLLNYIIILRNGIINTINLLKNPTAKFIDFVPQVPGREDGTLELTENRDYTINYKEGTLTLTDAWGIGTLTIEYYPLWIQKLELNKFPLRVDFQEEKFKDKTNLKLKTVPLDPLRSVKQYNPEKKEWTELAEDIDYKVDYPKKTIEILKTVKEEHTEFKVGYTPYLTDEGLALAYHMTRKDVNHQAIVNSCYFQNRV